MSRPRGRPALGGGVARDDILAAALTLQDENGGQGLTMRALATRLGVTPMSLYHHVGDQTGLLRALLSRYHDAVGRHPQLTLAIFATPGAFAGVTRQITDRLTALLAEITAEPTLWRNILVDHAHGSGLALASARGEQMPAQPPQDQDRQALDRLLDRVASL